MKGLLEEYERIFCKKTRVKRSNNNELTREYLIMVVLWDNYRKKFTAKEIAELVSKHSGIERKAHSIGVICGRMARHGLIKCFYDPDNKNIPARYQKALREEDVTFFDDTSGNKKGTFGMAGGA